MSQAESKNPTLSGSDILFECGECGKSLSIDFRGAGLNIRCPQCDSELEVPIPEGFDLAELDKEISASAESDEELKTITGPVETEAVSSDEREQVNKLMAELEALRAQRRHLEQQHVKMLKTIKTVNHEVDEFRKALDDLTAMLDSFDGSQSDGPQNSSPQSDGPQSDGPQSDSPQSDDPQNDGPQSDDPHNDETQKMG